MADGMTSNELKKILPLLARHEGVWEGTYRFYNVQGDQIDEHASRLICRFPAMVEDGRLKWDNEFINGWACDVALDDFNRTTMLNWTRTGEPDLYLYEMIQLSDDSLSRARVWQWFKADRLFQRTLVDETFVTKDWQSYEGREF